MAHVVVVGAGLAGARACAELRAAGFVGRLTLLGAEAESPYDRPPLTKEPGAEVDLRAAMGLDVWALADDVRLGAGAEALQVSPDGLVVGVGADRVRADAVVVATGADPVLPEGWAGPGVHALHTRDQADRLWARVGSGTRLDVVGGGWIGCEAAATAAARGARVRLHEAAGQLLPDRVPSEVAQRVRDWLVEAGVQVRVGAAVRGVLPGPDGPRVLGAGASHDADLVLVGLGVRPASGWLAGSGLDRAESGAVLVDAWGRTGVPGVVAVGDVAARWSPRAGAHLPGGHWTEALNAPTHAARALAGWLRAGAGPGDWSVDPAGEVPDPVPYVFSDIAGRTLQVLGDAAGSVVWRESAHGWSAVVLDEHDRLRGVASTGRPRDVAMARRVLQAADRAGLRVDPAAIADPGAPIAVVAPAGASASGA